MSDLKERTSTTSPETKAAPAVDLKLEIVVVPVSDVERAKQFYAKLGWRLDADFAGPDDYRVIQFTPPGSDASVIFGKNVTPAAPGSAQGLYLIVSDIEAARKVARRGVEVSEAFHAEGDVHIGTDEPYLFGRVRSAASIPSAAATLLCLVQRSRRQWLAAPGNDRAIARTRRRRHDLRLSGRLAAAFRRAAAAHGEHEKRNGGQHDENWPDWYAEYIVKEQPASRCRFEQAKRYRHRREPAGGSMNLKPRELNMTNEELQIAAMAALVAGAVLAPLGAQAQQNGVTRTTCSGTISVRPDARPSRSASTSRPAWPSASTPIPAKRSSTSSKARLNIRSRTSRR